MIPWWGCVIAVLVAVVAGGAAGFFGAQKFFKRQLKANPPINENVIRAIYTQVGRKPSETQIRQALQNINRYIDK